MANHVHVVIRMLPEVAASWTDHEVALRWLSIFGTRQPKGADGQVDAAIVAAYSRNPAWVAERRLRLGNLSWFMRSLSEPIAVQANREDKCSGRFWEGRFTSVPLLDQAALIACMAYVDLNPIRAKVADRPERAFHTGGRERIRARQRHRVGQKAQTRPAAACQHILNQAGLTHAPAHPEADVWLAPLHRCVVGSLTQRASSSAYRPTTAFTVDDYLNLIDLSGRVLRNGKRGAIPSELEPILARLDLSVEDWLTAITSWRSMMGSALGHAATRAREALRRGLDWIRNRCPLFVSSTTGEGQAA
jgi:hypothetical protein